MKKIILLLSVMLSVASCKDAIEITQDGEINDPTVAISSLNDMRTFLNGNVYTAVNPTTEIFFTSLFTDEVGFGPSSVSNEEILTHRWVLNPGSSYAAGIWAGNYNIINKVNILLKNANNVNYDSLSQDDQKAYKNILAHARALRAYAYLTLESYFSTDMKNTGALGVIKTTEPVDIFQAGLARTTNAEIYSLIDEDIAYALANLGTTAVNANVQAQHLITKPAVNAIAARYYLYRGDYANAKTYATTALSGLALSNKTVYPTIWTDAARGEVILSMSRPVSGSWSNIAGLWTTNTTDIGGSVRLDMGRRLFGLLNELTGDIRRDVFVDITSEYQYPSPDPRNKDVIVINKYPGKSNTPLRNDIKLFRSSEMAFIIAEASVATGDLVGAATQIRNVRQARTGVAQVVAFTTAAQAWNEILKERRRELCFEGHRYIDIKRFSTLNGAAIDRDATDDSLDPTMPTTLPGTDYRFTLPIPLAEINANPNVQQNPNY